MPRMTEKRMTITAWLPRTLGEEFRAMCSEEDVSMSNRVAALIARDVKAWKRGQTRVKDPAPTLFCTCRPAIGGGHCPKHAEAR